LKQDFRELYLDVIIYLDNAYHSVKPVLIFLGGGLSYILFPHQAFQTYAYILLMVTIFDVATKYYSISMKNGGLIKSFKEGHISSSKFWLGTRRKIVSYLTIMTLLGLSVRFEALGVIASFMSTLVYFLLFLRESQSILENLIDSGHSELEFFLKFITRKEKQVEQQLLDEENQNNQE
jgi:phage-related holin